jgi:hypothetical protein
MTNEHGIAWLKYFNAYIKPRTKGVYQLLIINGYKSYNSIKF